MTPHETLEAARRALAAEWTGKAGTWGDPICAALNLLATLLDGPAVHPATQAPTVRRNCHTCKWNGIANECREPNGGDAIDVWIADNITSGPMPPVDADNCPGWSPNTTPSGEGGERG